MRLLSHSAYRDEKMLMGWDKHLAGKEPTGESGRKVDIPGPSSFLGLLDNDLKRAAYGPSGTDGLTDSTPVTLLRFDNSHNIVNHHQNIVTAYANA